MLCMVYISCMADMVIRNLDDEFMRRVRAQSALDGLSLKDWVVSQLCAFLEGYEHANGRDGVHLRGDVESGAIGQGREGTRKPRKAVPAAHESARPSGESGEVVRSEQKNGSGERKGEVTAVDLTGNRPTHNVKTCRVYGCGMCKAEGKKF